MEKPEEKKNDSSVESTALLALRIRSLIADKEMVTAAANFDLARNGEWRCDYQAWHREINVELESLLSRASTKDEAQPPTKNP